MLRIQQLYVRETFCACLHVLSIAEPAPQPGDAPPYRPITPYPNWILPPQAAGEKARGAARSQKGMSANWWFMRMIHPLANRMGYGTPFAHFFMHCHRTPATNRILS